MSMMLVIFGALLLPIIIGSIRSIGWAASFIVVALVFITGAFTLIGDTVLTAVPWVIAVLVSCAAIKRPS